MRDALMVASVDKAFRVLLAFQRGDGDGSMSLAEIVKETGLEKSAAQRFAHTLQSIGLLMKDERTRRFRLSTGVLDLTYAYLKNNRFIAEATQVLLELRRTTEERVSLSLLDNGSLIYAVRQQSKRESFGVSIIGRRVPLHSTAGGRAVLACLPEDEARAMLEASHRTAFTPRTPTAVADVMDRVRETRVRGFGWSVDETVAGEVAVGAAVLDGKSLPIGAVHIVGSLAEWEPEAFAGRFGSLALGAAQSLSSNAARF